MADDVTSRPELVYAPWSPEQVSALEAWQAAPATHEYTCAACPESHPLQATVDGWFCHRVGGVVQNWCHAMSVQPPPELPPEFVAAQAVRPRAVLYDIGAFFTAGLNKTPEEAREWYEEVRVWAASLGERDQDDTVAVGGSAWPYDDLADLLDGFGRLLDMWEDDVHVLSTSDTGWSIEHSLRCRARGDMVANCHFHLAVELHLEDGGLLPAPGRYTLSLEGDVPDEAQQMRVEGDWMLDWDPR